MSYGKAAAPVARPSPYPVLASANGYLGSRNPERKVFVGSLPYSTTWQDLKDVFSQVGEVTYTKIIIDKQKGVGKGTANPEGWSKGMGMVEFSTEKEARLAIAVLNGTQVGGRHISVEPWTDHGQPPPKQPGPSATIAQVGKGKAKAEAWNKGKGAGKTWTSDSRNPSCKVYVGQLPYSTTWQDLKDHFMQVGTVVYTKILVDKAKGGKGGANPDGWSKGMGIVEFDTPEEAQLAVSTLNGTEIGGRAIVVDAWTTGKPGAS